MNIKMNWQSNRIRLLVGVLFALGLLVYSLPWLINSGSGLSFGAYDLAEWASLHPAVRGNNPVLLTSLLLRLPLTCLGLIITIGFLQGKSRLRLLLAILIAIAMLPPLEFFTQYQDDPNYQQQFLLAVITCVAGGLSIGLKTRSHVKTLMVLLVVVGVVSSLTGLIQGYLLLEQFKLPVQVGAGGIGIVIIYAIITWVFLMTDAQLIKQTR
jgi:hypothetical protein